jgi:bifunctional DNA-binding transcriptional regulator/antitoxin component of YhaV-PrlF toxin-antitoxin module
MAIVKLEVDENGEVILPLTDPIFQDLGWQVGDKILWEDNGDGSWTMSKKPKTKIVMVEAVQSFRIRYAVEIPEDAPEEWALDTVVCNDAQEFSQESLGEQIVSSRVISQIEFLTEYRKDHSYSNSWDDDTCFKNGLTEWSK